MKDKCQFIESHPDNVAWTCGHMEQFTPAGSTGQLFLSGHRSMDEHRAHPQTPAAEPIFTDKTDRELNPSSQLKVSQSRIALGPLGSTSLLPLDGSAPASPGSR